MIPIGPLMIDLQEQALSKEEQALILHPLVGGIILFTRNYSDPQQLRDLVTQIREVKPNLLIAVDQEGGRVQRFREGFTALPPASEMGAVYDTDPAHAIRLAHQTGHTMAKELRQFDIDFSFAPVVDLNYNTSEVIGSRSFHSQVDAVTELAAAYMRGMREAGMAAVAKHYPGHGFVAADSHTDIAIDNRDWDTLYQHDLQVFIRLISQNLTGIMAAHVIYPQICDQPAGYSPRWLKQVLRQQYGFTGAIFSDDISMAGGATLESFTARADSALRAGCDMVLICNHRAAVIEVLDELTISNGHESWSRLQQMAGEGCAITGTNPRSLS
jgi:beta-N-acetylhexosaminidase